MKIYVASSWRNSIQDAVVIMLRALGHEVYDFKNPPGGTGFSWAHLDENWREWTPEQYIKALKHPISEKGFNSDFNAMKWADCCVMVLPCGRSAHTEAGWMAGAGKKVIAYMPQREEPELMYKVFDDIATNYEELENALESVTLNY